MAVIGVKACYHNGHTVGKVTNVSCSITYKELSRLQSYKLVPDTAAVSIVSVGGFTEATICNVSGPLRWVTVELNNSVKTWTVHELPNVTLIPPDRSAVSRGDSISFSTFSINGKSWFCPDGIKETTVNSEATAITYAQEGWSDDE